MDHDLNHPATAPHEKIRFKREEITDLSCFPSAAEQVFPRFRPTAWHHAARVVAIAFCAVAIFVALVAVVISLVSFTGFGEARLRAAAEDAVAALADVEVDASFGSVTIAPDAKSLLALEISDVVVTPEGAPRPLLVGRRMRFGIDGLSLLAGKVRASGARIEDAQLDIGLLPRRDDARHEAWWGGLLDEKGRVDTDRAGAALFAAARALVEQAADKGLRDVRLNNVKFLLPDDALVPSVTIAHASLAAEGEDSVRFAADLSNGIRKVTVEATAKRDPLGGRMENLDLRAHSPAPENAAPGPDASALGTVDVVLRGVEGDATQPFQIAADISVRQGAIDFGSDGVVSGDVQVVASVSGGARRVEINRLTATAGRTVLDFYGFVAPADADAGEEGGYRYELASSQSLLGPTESPEPTLPFMAQAEGRVSADGRAVDLDSFRLRTSSGEASVKASFAFPSGETPGMSVTVEAERLPVSHVKQIWPWFAAPGARSWVLQHLFAGSVGKASVFYSVPPGRLGNGVPLTHDEVHGRFEVSGARVDLAGTMPPLRDTAGTIAFAGNDVDIALQSGTVFMQSGRSVSASNGTLAIRNANVRPVIGKLAIDVAGAADAVAELATYDPIEALQRTGMAPEDFSGDVSGRILADVPLNKDIPADQLGWKVDLDYENLALAKPMEGQKVTDAAGSLNVVPDRLDISAKARLNGIPAELSLVEPLNDDGPARVRKVALSLDDKARGAIAPGLDGIVSGTVKVELDWAAADTNRHVAADLTNAAINLPWAGWSKGVGIPATLSLTAATDGHVTRLSDIDLDGKSFGAKGEARLENDNLVSARLSNVRLSRGDDFALTIGRKGGGFSVAVSGQSLDARSVIRRFTAGTDRAGGSSGNDSVSVTANVDSVTGFHGEKLSGLKLSYRESDGQTLGFEADAKSSSGAAIAVRDKTQGSARSQQITAGDAGALLRFLDVYEHIEGGSITINLGGTSGGTLTGRLDARNFWIVGEPRLGSLVSTPPPGDNRSLSEAANARIDASRVQFDQGSLEIAKGGGKLSIANGVLRGPLIGATFQGVMHDEKNRMDMTGTFMPAYGINRIFGEVPLIGAILGNGRDRGLIGVTFKLEGDADRPQLRINPLSVIAPGIFRSIFEYR